MAESHQPGAAVPRHGRNGRGCGVETERGWLCGLVIWCLRKCERDGSERGDPERRGEARERGARERAARESGRRARERAARERAARRTRTAEADGAGLRRVVRGGGRRAHSGAHEAVGILVEEPVVESPREGRDARGVGRVGRPQRGRVARARVRGVGGGLDGGEGALDALLHRAHLRLHPREPCLRQRLHADVRPVRGGAVDGEHVVVGVTRGHARHADRKRHVEGAVRRVRAEPERAAARAGQPAARLRHVARGTAVDRDGPLPAREGLGGERVAVGRAPDARRDAPGQVERRAAQVVAVDGHHAARRDGRALAAAAAAADRHRKGVGRVKRERAIGGGQRRRRHEQPVGAPQPAAGVVFAAVLAAALAVGKDGGEVEGLPRLIPPAVRARHLQQVGRAQVVGRSAQVDLADHEHVGDHGHVAVGHARGGPDGRLAGGVGQDVEHPHLLRVAGDDRLAARRLLVLVEAVRLGERAHRLDRAPRCRAALERDLGERLDAEERVAAAVARPRPAVDRRDRRR
eukprot:189368-Prymnesium_polylepis.1